MGGESLEPRIDVEDFDDKPTEKDSRPILYELDIWKDGKRIRTLRIMDPNTILGRGSKAKVKLSDDDRIGRTHASLCFEDGKLIVESLNENPTHLGEKVLAYKQPQPIGAFDQIRIFGYTLIPKLPASDRPFDETTNPEELIRLGESKWLELKASLRWSFREQPKTNKSEEIILKTISAFANAEGGTLLIGVEDDGEVKGLNEDFQTLKQATKDYFELHFRNLLNAAFGKDLVAKLVEIHFPTVDGKDICRVKVQRSPVPLYCTTKDNTGLVTKFYIRSGNSSQELDVKETAAYVMARF